VRKALTVIGTRPQYIKYAAVANGLRRIFDEVFVDTGQHYDHGLSQALLDELGIAKPKYNLSARKGESLLQIADLLAKIHEVIERERPDVIVCFGDTNSTFAAALAGAKRGVSVAHIEAGERNFTASGHRVRPVAIPEETNRVLTDHIASVLLCSSRRALANLEAEQVQGRAIYTGDIIYDLFLVNRPRAFEMTSILDECDLKAGEYYFCTIHRALNTDNRDRLGSIVRALVRLPKPAVFPLHPRTRRMLDEFGLYEELRQNGRVRLLEPVSYLESLALNCHARGVVTDSGGVLREAFFNGVMSVCLDDSTEWIDVVEAGWSIVAGADTKRILNATERRVPQVRPELFGCGDAVERTVEALAECYT
jgi:UDP-N-acetylglucosamine 2-epimerase